MTRNSASKTFGELARLSVIDRLLCWGLALIVVCILAAMCAMPIALIALAMEAR